MDEWNDEINDIFFPKDDSAGKKLIVVEDGNRKSYFLYGNENWDIMAGRELLEASLEAGYVYDRVIQLLRADDFVLQEEMPSEFRYIITADCRQRTVTCFDTKKNIELDPCMMMSFDELRRYGGTIGPSMEQVIEWSRFKDMDKLTDEEWDLHYQEKVEARKWRPAYPVDLDNPVLLTNEQRAHGEMLYQKVADFMENQPEDDHCPPMFCISQSWDISIDFGGLRSDSDVVRSILDILCKDDDRELGYYLDEDYVIQCIPFIEKELEEAAQWCMEEYGEVPDGAQTRLDDRMNLEMQFIEVAYYIMDKDCMDDMVVAVDTCERCAYPAPRDSETYGDIIRLFPVTDFLEKDGDSSSLNIDKIHELIQNI